METNSSTKIGWTVGLSVALGVPLLIIPSIEYFTIYLAAGSVLIWLVVVMEGFFQNMAYGEMAVDYPEASGVPGYAQIIIGRKHNGFLRFLGGFSAWGYWFAWAPIPSIFALSISDMLVSIFPLSGIPRIIINITVGTVVMALVFLMNRKGLSESAVVGYIMNIISLVPLAVIALVPILAGKADWSNVFHSSYAGVVQGASTKMLLLLFGLCGMAEWSACAWETAAIYAPEYRNPVKDTPKALISCGAICFVFFGLIQTSCVAVLGTEATANAQEPAMLLLARESFGDAGAMVAAFVIIVAMFSIIQTGFAGASRAMAALAQEGNLPSVFGRLNTYEMPQNAMIAIILINYIMLLVGSSAAIVAASSVGYSIANGIALMAYVVHKSGKKEKTGFCMPAFWKYIILVFAAVNLFGYTTGLLYLNYLDYGGFSLLLCAVILLTFVPMYMTCRRK